MHRVIYVYRYRNEKIFEVVFEVDCFDLNEKIFRIKNLFKKYD